MFSSLKKAKPIYTQLIIFSLLFILFSGVIGSWVVPTKLLYGFGFYIYGNLGKLVLISGIVFGLLLKQKQDILSSLPAPKHNWFFLLMSLPLTILFFVLGQTLLGYESFLTNIPLSIATHATLILVPVSLLVGVFGPDFIKAFIKAFYKELFLGALLAIAYDLAIFQVWKLWPYFSQGVLQVVRMTSLVFTHNVQVIAPYTLYVNNFGVEIAEACSGLDSLFMFLTLSFLAGAIDWKNIPRKRLALMFIPGLIGLYLVNILRVFSLVMIGAFVSPELALKLFHTYLGMVLFIVYFFWFWRVVYSKSRSV
jgi:exosortase/archaeosortase family protein